MNNNIENDFEPDFAPVAKLIVLSDKSLAMIMPDGTIFDRAA